MKILRCDAETTKILSYSYTHSQLIDMNIYLSEPLDAPLPQPIYSAKCLVFIRPTKRNVDILRKELHSPRHCEYHLFFTNFLPESALRELALADRKGVIKNIQVPPIYHILLFRKCILTGGPCILIFSLLGFPPSLSYLYSVIWNLSFNGLTMIINIVWFKL